MNASKRGIHTWIASYRKLVVGASRGGGKNLGRGLFLAPEHRKSTASLAFLGLAAFASREQTDPKPLGLRGLLARAIERGREPAAAGVQVAQSACRCLFYRPSLAFFGPLWLFWPFLSFSFLSLFFLSFFLSFSVCLFVCLFRSI